MCYDYDPPYGSYEWAVDNGYDGPSPAEERRMKAAMRACNAARGGPNACGLCESCVDPTCEDCGVELGPDEEEFCANCKPAACTECEDDMDEETEDGLCTWCRNELAEEAEGDSK